ncbi:MAG: SDR family NAD(P)-dependent oxidoreductase [Acidimicrobiales bacterium]
MGQVPVNDDDDDELRDRLRAVTEELEALAVDRSLLHRLPDAERIRLLNAAGDVFSPDVEARRRQAKARRRQEKLDKRRDEQEVLTGTGIRQLRARPVFTTPNVFPPEGFEQDTVEPGSADGPHREAPEPQHCYVCKQHYDRVHHFYDQLCPDCAEVSYAKRTESADLRGRVALLTGGRVKIGYQAGIKLLRSGAHLIVTTRFPRDAAVRYSQEADFEDWRDRLEVHGLDLRHTPSVESFCTHLERTHDRLDHIVNNACQTVRRPPAFYRHMLEQETGPLASLPAHVQALLGGHDGVRAVDLVGESSAALALGAGSDGARSVELSQLALLPEDLEHGAQLFPDGTLDQDLQQVDLRGRNSWRLTLAEVSSVELLETQLVNAVAPFVLNARLKPLMLRTAERDKHIVNVSAVEGQFYRRFKTTKHPHTNMAKAALNMMTRTSAADYHADGIHMNSVDTGWVSDEDPVHIAEQKQAEHGFHPPLDIVDGAARIVDPIISGANTGEHVWGQFLKDFRPTDW